MVNIPGFREYHFEAIVTDYTGTLACGGELTTGAYGGLMTLSKLVDITVLTSDTFGTVKRELDGIPLEIKILEGDHHDSQKLDFVKNICVSEMFSGYGANRIIALGNGRNDEKMLEWVNNEHGIAIAVDNGEGCATGTLQASTIFVHGAANALGLLLDADHRLKATLRS